ncbi:MAG: alpha/beta hydrolase [Anaerolineae bacterium]|nr:alpha/beta hydrolase [Anaerolineae bacterium]
MITTEQYAQLPAVEADAVYVYGDDPNQRVDLYLPTGDGTPFPVVVLIHGGCWRDLYSAKPLGGLCRALNAVGVAVWNVEYRRNGNGGGFPNTMLDVGRGTDLLREAAREHALDLTRVVSMGHSAGGQLALWLAARAGLRSDSPVYVDNPLRLRGVVGLAGIIDLIGAAGAGLCGENLSRVMGGLPVDVPEHYQDASPMERLPLGVRQIHLVGEHDTGILANIQAYVNAAVEAGDEVRLEILPEAGHFELVVAGTAAWTRVEQAVLSLVG